MTYEIAYKGKDVVCAKEAPAVWSAREREAFNIVKQDLTTNELHKLVGLDLEYVLPAVTGETYDFSAQGIDWGDDFIALRAYARGILKDYMSLGDMEKLLQMCKSDCWERIKKVTIAGFTQKQIDIIVSDPRWDKRTLKYFKYMGFIS